jgi:hypothetical protein
VRKCPLRAGVTAHLRLFFCIFFVGNFTDNFANMAATFALVHVRSCTNERAISQGNESGKGGALRADADSAARRRPKNK